MKQQLSDKKKGKRIRKARSKTGSREELVFDGVRHPRNTDL